MPPSSCDFKVAKKWIIRKIISILTLKIIGEHKYEVFVTIKAQQMVIINNEEIKQASVSLHWTGNADY